MEHSKKIVVSALSLLVAGALVAGPLNPPAGSDGSARSPGVTALLPKCQ
jgi:hypothetical protein